MWRFPNSPLSAMFHRVLRMVRSICPKEPERWISRYPADTQEDTAGRVVVVCRQQFWRFSGGRGIRLRLLDDILRLLFTCLACPTLTSLKFSTEGDCILGFALYAPHDQLLHNCHSRR